MQQTEKQEVLSLIPDITFSQVPGWFEASGRDLKMSIICPKVVENHEKLPVIVWLCGGAYLDMDENVWLPQMVRLAQRGFVIASPQYRTSNQAEWPAPLIDVKSAVRYLRAKADRYAIDPQRISIMGESAGGTFAALCSVTNGNTIYDAGDHMEYSSDVQKVVDLYGLVDFEMFRDLMDKVPAYNDPVARAVWYFRDHAKEGSALRQVTEQTPPTIIFHGTDDELVPTEQSKLYYEALQACGVRSDLYIVEGAVHGDDLFYQENIYDIITDFLNEP